MPGSADQHIENNNQSRERLRSLVARLDAQALARRLPNGWSVAMTLEHIAFWDRFVVQRWQDTMRNARRSPTQMGDQVTDFVNAALEPILVELDPAEAGARADRSAHAANQVIQGVPRDLIEEVIREDRPRLIDRSLHRNEHLDEIEASLARPEET
jgi:hypothetical protein